MKTAPYSCRARRNIALDVSRAHTCFLLQLSHFLPLRPRHQLYAFFFAAALAFAAFFLLLRIMTTPRKDPTTAEPTRRRMTGIRMAQTRGGKNPWRGCTSSTKGYREVG